MNFHSVTRPFAPNFRLLFGKRGCHWNGKQSVIGEKFVDLYAHPAEKTQPGKFWGKPNKSGLDVGHQDEPHRRHEAVLAARPQDERDGLHGMGGGRGHPDGQRREPGHSEGVVQAPCHEVGGAAAHELAGWARKGCGAAQT